MSEQPPLLRGILIGSLSETRRLIRTSHARMMVVFFGILYALGSMVLGGMLLLTHVRGGFTTEILWGNALGTGAWNYPGLLVVAPWGVVSLPFLATISMVVVSTGVGIGVSVALLIAAHLVRDRRRSAAGAGSVGSVAGLTPAMVALVTLGACCSTTAAASAGVGIVAQASGTTIDSLLINNWYLDVFQIAVMYVALLAQELVLRAYGGLLGLGADPVRLGTEVPPVRATGPVIGRTAVRAVLLLAGVTWSVGMFAEWAGASPSLSSGPLWFQWIFQHQLLADVAIVVALVPAAVGTALLARQRTLAVYALRAALLVAGLSLVAWTPAPVATAGAPGFLNEVFGALGLPATWGAVAPVFSPGLALYARWGFQYLLLGGFGLAIAIRPQRVLRPFLASPTASPSWLGSVPTSREVSTTRSPPAPARASVRDP